jgi:orotate phosphoribosyltransferase
MTRQDAPVSDQAQSILDVSLKLGALRFGEFTLSGGGTARYYFDGRLVTLDPEGSYLVATALLPLLRERGIKTVAGPALAAVPMVSAIAVLSHVDGDPINALIVRDEAKGHGTKRLIEGSFTAGARVAVIDDTCSTGGSLLHAIDAMEAADCEVVVVACILDRQTGGSAAIRERGHEFIALLEADAEGDIAPVTNQ